MEALRWWLTSERDQHFLDREPMPLLNIQSSVKGQVDECLRHGDFEDVEYLKSYSGNPSRIALRKLTIRKIDDDNDLIYLLRFPEIQEVCVPVKNITDRGFMILSALTSLRKLTLIAPSLPLDAAHTMGETGLQEVERLQTDATEKGLQELKTRLPQVQVEFQIED